jgi:hypothetical protein
VANSSIQLTHPPAAKPLNTFYNQLPLSGLASYVANGYFNSTPTTAATNQYSKREMLNAFNSDAEHQQRLHY